MKNEKGNEERIGWRSDFGLYLIGLSAGGRLEISAEDELAQKAGSNSIF